MQYSLVSPDKMTFSAMQRYVLICQTILNTDRYLSGDDKCQLMWELLDKQWNPTKEQIEHECKQLEDKTLGNNMIKAGIVNRAMRGY